MAVSATFTIGATNYAGYIAPEGVKWQRNDLDHEDSGRTLDGTMQRSRVAVKRKLTVALRPLSQAEMQSISAAIGTEYVTLTYIDPELGSTTKTFYGSSIEAATLLFRNNDAIWTGGTFSLIER